MASYPSGSKRRQRGWSAEPDEAESAPRKGRPLTPLQSQRSGCPGYRKVASVASTLLTMVAFFKAKAPRPAHHLACEARQSPLCHHWLSVHGSSASGRKRSRMHAAPAAGFMRQPVVTKRGRSINRPARHGSDDDLDLSSDDELPLRPATKRPRTTSTRQRSWLGRTWASAPAPVANGVAGSGGRPPQLRPVSQVCDQCLIVQDL